MSKKVPLHRLLQPTMVSNGRGGLPRHRYTSRLRMNPSADPFGDDDDVKVSSRQSSSPASHVAAAIEKAQAKAGGFRARIAALKAEKEAEIEAKFSKKKGPKGPDKRGQHLKEMWAKHPEVMRARLEKAHEVRSAKAELRAVAKQEIKSAKEKIRAQIKAEQAATKMSPAELARYRLEVALPAARAKRMAEAEAKRAAHKAKMDAYHAEAAAKRAEREAAKLPKSELARLRKEVWLPAAREARGSGGSKMSAEEMALLQKLAKKAGLIKNGSSSGYMSRLLAKNPAGYTLSSNPVVDFELGGIKVVPALCGVAGASFLTAGIGSLEMVQKIENKTVRDVVPAGVTVALAVAAYSWAKKNNHDLTAQVCSDLTAFGIFQGVNALIAGQVEKAIASIKSKSSSAPQTPAQQPASTQAPKGFSGGRFEELSGGGWGRSDESLPSLEGYVVKNSQSSGYPTAFMSGSTGYPPSSLYGQSSDSAAALQAVALAGGRFAHTAGHDMSEYAE